MDDQLDTQILQEGKNFMQIGGVTFAKASIDEGRIHRPSPQIKPEATAGTITLAFFELSLCHTNTTKLPIHISIPK